jgi:tetratricopeptide (TPR) repeat protein
MRGAPEEALPALERARSLDARDRQVLDALRRTLEALLAREERDDLKESLADVRIETGDLDGAIPVLQKVSDACPRKREVTAKLARCFLEKGHPLVASRSLERALGDEEISPENVEVFYTLARAYEAAADLRKAKLAFERIGFFRYDYRDVRERLASLTAKVASTPSTPVTPSPLAPVPERSTLGGLETAELPSGRVEGGRFEILELRGRGGMALVYKALDHEFDPPLLVALKVLPEEFAHREKAVRLLKREASAAVQLSHPGIVRIFSTGEEQGKRYISMEYIEGPDLATVLDRKGKIPADAAEGILRQALDALGYAHRAGVIHKDIKPSNIMLTEDTPAGRVKITDFGIARVVTDQIGFSRTLSVRGTLPYMSPQQIAGEPADAQSDLYSLGITFYEMLAGEPPFSRGDVAYQHTYKEPAPPSALAEGIPPRLEAVVMKCLQKKLVNRYKSAEEILGDLDRKA